MGSCSDSNEATAAAQSCDKANSSPTAVRQPCSTATIHAWGDRLGLDYRTSRPLAPPRAAHHIPQRQAFEEPWPQEMPSRPQPIGSHPPNAHYIFPTDRRLDKCAVVVSGDEDRYTGRDRILSSSALLPALAKRNDGQASPVSSAEPVSRTAPPARTAGIELMNAPPYWHRSAPMLEYYVKYAHGFVFVFNMSSQETLELVSEMCHAVVHTAQALGMIVGNRSGPIPIVLVGNVSKNLRRRDDDTKEEADSSQDRDRAAVESVRAEAEKLAQRWGLGLCEVDGGSGAGLSGGANEALLALLRKIKETPRTQGSGVAYGFSEMKPPQRLLVRRTIGRFLPGALLKLFAK